MYLVCCIGQSRRIRVEIVIMLTEYSLLLFIDQVLWSLLFSVPVFLLAMVFSYLPRVKEGLNTNVGGFTINELVQWILTTPVQVCHHSIALNVA